MPARISLIGKTFESLTFIKPAEPIPVGNGRTKPASWWLCKCGKEIVIRNESVRGGYTKSCGCSHKQINITHGQCSGGVRTKAYACWCGIIDRCENPNKKCYKNYGGRGITMCGRWRNSFKTFFNDMGPGKKGWTIERIKNEGNYEPGNCVWATYVHQARNRSNNLIYTFRGVTATLIELVEKFGGNYRLIRWRLLDGWEPEKAFFQPARKRSHDVGSLTEPGIKPGSV